MLPRRTDTRTEALIARARGGDEAAFTELYALHRRRVMRSLEINTSADLVEIDEVVHEALAYVFIQIRAGGFDGPQTVGGFRAYLVKAAKSKLAEGARRRGARKRGAGRVVLLSELRTTTAADLGLVAPGAGPATKAGLHELGERIVSAIRQLKPADREVVDMFRNQQMTVAEIADELGITQAGVRARLHQAMGRLRPLLQGLVGGSE